MGWVFLTVVMCAGAAGLVCAHPERTAAEALWEQAIAARGGRERLAAIRSFAIEEDTTFRRGVRGVASRRFDVIVSELPDGWWEFLDYRPGAMGYSVRVLDTRTGRGWSTFGGPPQPLLRPDRDTVHRLRQIQYVYFMETRWVRPVPLRISRARLGFRSVDRLETDVEGERAVFYLDARTHLPVRIETARQISYQPPRPGMKASGEVRWNYEIEAYQEIGGVQVPARLRRGADPSRARVEINPEYDPAIFTTPPSPSDGPESWRRR